MPLPDMKEFSLQSQVVPPVTAYPKTFSGFLSFLANYLFFDDKVSKREYVIDPVKPATISQDSDKIWFQSQAITDFPLVPRVYSSGKWEGFVSLNQGDLVLIPSGAEIKSPWGEAGGVIYNVIIYQGVGANTTLAYTTPSVATAPPPSGFKYKVYVGYY